jgi:hypothetical protein
MNKRIPFGGIETREVINNLNRNIKQLDEVMETMRRIRKEIKYNTLGLRFNLPTKPKKEQELKPEEEYKEFSKYEDKRYDDIKCKTIFPGILILDFNKLKPHKLYPGKDCNDMNKYHKLSGRFYEERILYLIDKCKKECGENPKDSVFLGWYMNFQELLSYLRFNGIFPCTEQRLKSNVRGYLCNIRECVSHVTPFNEKNPIIESFRNLREPDDKKVNSELLRKLKGINLLDRDLPLICLMATLLELIMYITEHKDYEKLH